MTCHIGRRQFITIVGGSIAWPFAAGAQDMRRVGVLLVGPTGLLAAFQEGMSAYGYEDGKNISLFVRRVERPQQIPQFAAELLALKPDLIVTAGADAIRSLRDLTTTVPIVVAAASDLVVLGYAASIARPGGNVTGFQDSGNELIGKQLELAKQMLASTTRVAIIHHPNSPIMLKDFAAVEAVAAGLGLQLVRVPISSVDELEAAFPAAKRAGAEFALVIQSNFTIEHNRQLVELASRERLPTIYPFMVFVQIGGLMSYGASLTDMWRRAADYVHRILDGADPGALPVQSPIKFELALNIKTANALGLDVPPILLARADETIK
jgi:putative tryptophan/tyrosine transport system substrate-binding protein